MFVGSVHHVHTMIIDGKQPLYEEARRLAGGTDELLFQEYLDNQYEMLKTLKPPVVGHFDVIRLRSDKPNGTICQWDTVWAKAVRNLKFIAEYGGLVELNSASLRKGMSEPYPTLEICQVLSTF